MCTKERYQGTRQKRVQKSSKELGRKAREKSSKEIGRKVCEKVRK